MSAKNTSVGVWTSGDLSDAVERRGIVSGGG